MGSKRIINEVNKNFPATMEKYDLSFSLCYVNSETIPNALVICNVHGRVIFRINCSDYYPFKAPMILINAEPETGTCSLSDNFMSYNYWLRNIIKPSTTNYFNAWFFTILAYPQLKSRWSTAPESSFKNSCLCCNSTTCSHNWHPSITIGDIFLEYFIRRKFKSLCSPLMQRYINSIFDNDRWSLPDDIILLIGGHL